MICITYHGTLSEQNAIAAQTKQCSNHEIYIYSDFHGCRGLTSTIAYRKYANYSLRTVVQLGSSTKNYFFFTLGLERPISISDKLSLVLSEKARSNYNHYLEWYGANKLIQGSHFGIAVQYKLSERTNFHLNINYNKTEDISLIDQFHNLFGFGVSKGYMFQDKK